jgi:hypothetical protein
VNNASDSVCSGAHCRHPPACRTVTRSLAQRQQLCACVTETFRFHKQSTRTGHGIARERLELSNHLFEPRFGRRRSTRRSTLIGNMTVIGISIRLYVQMKRGHEPRYACRTRYCSSIRHTSLLVIPRRGIPLREHTHRETHRCLRWIHVWGFGGSRYHW